MKSKMLHAKTEFTNVRELLEWAGEKYGDNIAFSYKEALENNALKSKRF